MSGGAPQHGLDGLAAAVVAQLDAVAPLDPASAPAHQRDDDREDVRALLGEPVALPRALARLAIVLALEQARGDELAEPRRGGGVGDLGAPRELLEAGRPVERLAQEQERRARSEQLERRGHRAAVGRPSVARLERSEEVNGLGPSPHSHS